MATFPRLRARRQARLTTREDRHVHASRAGDPRSHCRLAAHLADSASCDACRRWLRIQPILESVRRLQDFVRCRQLSDRFCGSSRSRPVRRQGATLPLPAVFGAAVRDRHQLKPRVNIARSEGSRRLRAWHRHGRQPGPHPCVGAGIVRGSSCRDAGRRRYPFRLAPNHRRLRRHLRSRFFSIIGCFPDRTASVGAVARRTHSPRDRGSPQAWIRDAMILATSTRAGIRQC